VKREPTRRPSLRTWFVLAFSFLLITPILIVLIIASASSTSATSSTSQLHGQTFDPANQTIQMVLKNVSLWENPKWQSKLREKLSTTSMGIRLFNPKQTMIFSYTPNDLRTIVSHPKISMRIQSHLSSSIDYQETWIVQKHLIFKGSVILGIAYIEEPMIILGNKLPPYTSFHDWVSGPGGIFVWFFAFVMSFLLIMYFIGKVFVSKMKRVEVSVRKINLGDFDADLPSSVIREVNDLSVSLAIMKDNLSAALMARDKVEQERRLMMASIVHDLRTPIFTIVGYLEGLQKGIVKNTDKADRYIDVCLEKSLLINQLVTDLFTYSTIDQPEQTLHCENIDWVIFIDRVIEGFRIKAANHDVNVTHDYTVSSIFISGDPDLLIRAISNVIENAFRYTPEGSDITLLSEIFNQQLRFTVADAGLGFLPQDVEHIFKPFYRGDKSRNRKTGGFGLGLSITKQIITAHGGQIHASNLKAGGACISIFLPLLQGPEPKARQFQ